MDIKDTLQKDVDYNKNLYEYTKAVKLPVIILDPDDVYGFFLESGDANYITLKKVKAHVILEKDIGDESPMGKIVFIKSADPGYDFLFTKNIAGLVTQYGGANSHMSIRCAELGIPAVIGAGEKNFEEWSSYDKIEIDCSNRRVMQIS
jgi:phosphohistidine swiveling domain-containing protein